VILVIGDGMGVAHFTAARLLRGADYRIGTMPVAGLVSTHALNSIAPDSASSASAYATGAKINYRALSVDPSGRPLETALEIAERTGRATGLVTTANFYDATPAAFAAHVSSRYESDVIISQMLQSGVEIIVGGGAAKFTDDAVATAKGFTVARTGPALFSTDAPHILGVFTTQKNEMEFPDAPLLQIAPWAIDRLSRDPDGFFLLLEHEGTDGASHANATEDFMTAVKALDAMAGIALDFAASNPDTLVIVTGDHETGGLQILPENKQELELRWGGKGHTAEMLPIFARGPGAERFSGAMDNDEVGRRLKQLLSKN
jgi:alkaline phosphatase